MAAGVLVIRDARGADAAAVVAGAVLLVWIAAQMALLRTANWLQLGCIAAALAIIVLAMRRDVFTTSSSQQHAH